MNTYKTNDDIELGDFHARKNKDWCNIIWIITEYCNLGCSYCVGWKKSKGPVVSLIDSIGVDGIISRFEDLRERSGKNLYITLTGGEPTIIEDFPRLCAEFTKKKFVLELQSNLISPRVKEFVDAVDPKYVGQIMASYRC